VTDENGVPTEVVGVSDTLVALQGARDSGKIPKVIMMIAFCRS